MTHKEFIHRRRVEFHETDLAGIVHFSNYFRYMEAAECAMFRELGISIVDGENEPKIAWPRGEVACRFEAPLRFEDVVDIAIRPREIRPKRITYDVRILKRDDDRPVLVATGSTTAICAHFDTASGRLCSTEIPQEIRRRLDQFFQDEAGAPPSDSK